MKFTRTNNDNDEIKKMPKQLSEITIKELSDYKRINFSLTRKIVDNCGFAVNKKPESMRLLTFFHNFWDFYIVFAPLQCHE